MNKHKRFSDKKILELVKRSKNGDHAAVSELMQFIYIISFHVAKRFSRRDSNLLRDYAQAGAIAIWERAVPQFNPKENKNFKGYASKTAHNEMINCWRKNKIRDVQAIDPMILWRIEEGSGQRNSTMGVRQVFVKECEAPMTKGVVEFISTAPFLTDTDRKIIYMRFGIGCEDLQIPVIARRLKMNHNSVKTRLYRSLEKLKDLDLF